MPINYTIGQTYDRTGGGSYNFDLTVDPGLVSSPNATILALCAIVGQVPFTGGEWNATSPAGSQSAQLMWIDTLGAETELGVVFINHIGSDATRGNGGYVAGAVVHSGSLGTGLPAGGTVRLRGSSDVTITMSAVIAIGLWDSVDAGANVLFLAGGNPNNLSGNALALRSNLSRSYEFVGSFGAGVASEGSGRWVYTGSPNWENQIELGHSGNYGRVYAHITQYTGALNQGVDTLIPFSITGGAFEQGFTGVNEFYHSPALRARAKAMVIG